MRISYIFVPHKIGIRLLGIMENPANSFPARPLALAILATRYGAAGMSMWYQRDRSLVPCSLMALIR